MIISFPFPITQAHFSLGGASFSRYVWYRVPALLAKSVIFQAWGLLYSRLEFVLRWYECCRIAELHFVLCFFCRANFQ
jgi:hypothetical protein